MPEEVKYKYFNHGGVESKRYFKDGVLHREDAPAIILYFDDTNNPKLPHIYNYYVFGELHREDGPARLIYSRTGKCVHYSYSLCDEHISTFDYDSIIELAELMKTYDRNKLIMECSRHKYKFIREKCGELLCQK